MAFNDVHSDRISGFDDTLSWEVVRYICIAESHNATRGCETNTSFPAMTHVRCSLCCIVQSSDVTKEK